MKAILEVLSRNDNDGHQGASPGGTDGDSRGGSHGGRGENNIGGRNGNNNSPSSFVLRYTKLEFPRYDGSIDPLSGIHKCEHFFAHQNTNEGDKVSLAFFHLKGVAQLWLIKVKRGQINLSWEEFTKLCNMRFGPPMDSNKMG